MSQCDTERICPSTKNQYCEVATYVPGTPSYTPTEAPTLHPTLAPTPEPTLNPTLAPTLEPTLNPTLAPTLEPTLNPTLAPTPVPTLNPTEAPTIDYLAFETSMLYGNYTRAAEEAEEYGLSNTYDYFSYRGNVFEDSCADWKKYSNTLQLPLDTHYISTLRIAYGFVEYNDAGEAANTVEFTSTCANRDDIKLLVDAFIGGGTAETTCGSEQVWRAYTCKGNSVVCVDCEQICEDDVEEDGSVISYGDRLCPARESFFVDDASKFS